jgi:hypothetical protein
MHCNTCFYAKTYGRDTCPAQKKYMIPDDEATKQGRQRACEDTCEGYRIERMRLYRKGNYHGSKK